MNSTDQKFNDSNISSQFHFSRLEVGRKLFLFFQFVQMKQYEIRGIIFYEWLLGLL